MSTQDVVSACQHQQGKAILETLDKPIPSRPIVRYFLLVGLIVMLVWSYWPVLSDMASKWQSDPQYSHAYLVPVFSLWLAWRGWKTEEVDSGSHSWLGVWFLAAGSLFRLAGARFYVDWFEAISLLPVLAGCVLLLAGRMAFRRWWTAIAFLAFMIPLPYRVEHGLSLPLQRLATAGSTYVLQTLGRPAFAEGNVIVINEARIGVIGACNGLGMFLLFFAIATAVAMLNCRPWWEKTVLVLSAAPIAVGVNIGRITFSGLAHEFIGTPWADAIFHDFAGLFMIPLALIALAIEAKVLARLFLETPAVASGLAIMPIATNAGKRASGSRQPTHGTIEQVNNAGRRPFTPNRDKP